MTDDPVRVTGQPAFPAEGTPGPGLLVPHPDDAGHVPALAARGITKRFPGVLANSRVTFDVLPGEVHALLGENGAGKTTLCNVLTGLYRPDEGYLELGVSRPASTPPGMLMRRGSSWSTSTSGSCSR